MKAIVITKYGPPDVLRREKVEKISVTRCMRLLKLSGITEKGTPGEKW